ncbi:hypothetical protein Tco_1062409 [Tanacetum coccineum]
MRFGGLFMVLHTIARGAVIMRLQRSQRVGQKSRRRCAQFKDVGSLIASGAHVLNRAVYHPENKEVNSGMYLCDAVAIIGSLLLSSSLWGLRKVEAESRNIAYLKRKVTSYIVMAGKGFVMCVRGAALNAARGHTLDVTGVSRHQSWDMVILDPPKLALRRKVL